MLPYRAVCFDFDYTLGDSTDSIVAGFQHAFPILGWPAPDRETVRGTIGYLLEDSYTMLTGDESAEHRARFRALFLEVAQERQRTETVLFPGAADLLRGLKARGVPAAIVSTTPNGIAPGTRFADLPEDFVCPLCGVGKDQFEEA